MFSSRHCRSDALNLSAPLLVLVDGRLDSVSTSGWYLFADPVESPAFEVCGLGQRPKPAIDSRINEENGNLEIKVSLDFDGAFVDYRPCFYNPGA